MTTIVSPPSYLCHMARFRHTSRNSLDADAKFLIDPKGTSADGLLSLLKAYAARILTRVRYCDEKAEFLVTVLETEERVELIARLREFALQGGKPIDEDELPSPWSKDEITCAIGQLAGRLPADDVARVVEHVIARSLAASLLEDREPVRPSGQLATRVVELARIFNLTFEDSSVLLFYFAVKQCDELESLFDKMLIQMKPRFVAACCGIAESDVIRALSASGSLIKSGLLSRDDDEALASVQFAPMLVDGLAGFIGSLSHERLCMPGGRADFALDDFSLPPLAVAIARDLVASGRPLNILLHGEPGTGKTEFAKSLAAVTGKEAWFLGQGLSGAVKDRQAALSMSVASLDPLRQILVVDEADSLLSVGRSIFTSPTVVSKSWINGFLETPTRTIIWIVNWTELMDDSIKRRFSFALAFERFTPLDRRRLWAAALAGRDPKLKAELNPSILRRLSEEYETNAAGIGSALALLDSLRAQGNDTGTETLIRSSLESQTRLVEGALSRPSNPPARAYDPGVLNLDMEREHIFTALKNWTLRRDGPDRRGLRLLFWGAPGTGKTELARHLAAETGLLLVVRRASDLLSMFVGGTEKAIAAAFREAEREDGLLLVDEADSFLRERSRAEKSWEVTAVNEFLTQMEAYRGVLVCCTNLVSTLDAASLRRFQLKVEFKPLGAEGIARLLSGLFPTILQPADAKDALAPFVGLLSPGDVAAVADRLEFAGTGSDWNGLLNELGRECALKRSERSIGFR